MLLKDEADIRMPGTIPVTPSTTLGYTQHSIIDTYYAIMTLKDREDLYYEDYDTFGTIKVGVSRSLYESADLEDTLAKVNITQDQLIFYDGYNACREALDNGEVDALISNIMDLDDEMKQLDKFDTVSNYISMRIGDRNLLAINNAISQISQGEPTFLSELYKKWFPERAAVPLTKEEIEYLRGIDSLTFAFRDGQGYLSRKNEDGMYVGVFPMIAQRLCDELGVDCIQTSDAASTDESVIHPDFYYDYNWAQEQEVSITQSYMSVSYYELA